MPKINIDGVKIYFEEAGDGFPVVFNHGYNSNHYEWALQLPLLSRSYRVIAIDHRGHGFSDSPGSPEKYSIPIFAADILAVLKSLNIEKCHLIGQSMGGFVSLQFIKDFPEMVRSLVLVSTSAELSGMADYNRYMKKVHDIARSKGIEAAFEYTTTRDPIMKQYLEKYPYKLEPARQKLLNNNIDGYTYSWGAIEKWAGVWDYLKYINVPVAILAGQEDPFILEKSKQMANQIPNSFLDAIPHAGHSLPEEVPYTFNKKLTDFLSSIG